MKTMKNLILLSILTSLLLLTESCSKEKTCSKIITDCSKITEGLYQGLFTNDGSSNSTYNPGLYLTIVDENTISINLTSIPNFSSPNIQRNGCNVKGIMGAMIGTQFKNLDIVGEISRKKGDYIISGNYSYMEYSSGLGNPNPQYWEVKGTFEIESN